MRPALALCALALACQPPDEVAAQEDGAISPLADAADAASAPIGDASTGEIDCALAEIELVGCVDEAPLDLSTLCEAPAALLFNFYGWCASCRRYLEGVDALHLRFAAQGLTTIVVISEDAIEAPATVDYCRAFSEYFELSAPAFIDPTGAIEARYGGPDFTLVSAEGAVILSSDEASLEAIEAAVEGLF